MIAELWELRTALRNLRLSADELNALQECKLAAIVQHAYSNVEYYQALFRSAGLTPHDIRRVEDLRHVPVTTKAQLKAAGVENTTVRGVDLTTCIMTPTSGSTGMPFATYRSRREARTRHILDFRVLLSAGLRPRDRFLSLGPTWRPQNRLHHQFGLYRAFVLSRLQPIAEQIDQVKRIRPDVFWVYPTLLRALLQGVDYRLCEIARPRVLITGAEVFDDVLRNRVRADLDVEIFNSYGAIEVGRIAHECRRHTGLHVNVDNVVFECLNGDSPADVNEHGVAVVTSLNRFTMPMIRYRLEDRCQRLAQRCPCGSSFPLIGPPQGRSWEMIRLPSGQMVSPLTLNNFLRELEGIDQFRVIQESPDHLVVQLASPRAIAAAAVARLEAQIRGHLREPMRVDIERVEYQPADGIKFKTFVSRLHRAEADRA